MHREKQILLGFLGLLCGGFVAVLGAKLFIPRPPAGAGPDIDAPPALVAPQLVVEPPALSATAERQAVPRPEPRAEDPPPPASPPAPIANDRYASASGFARRDDLVAPAAFLAEPAAEPAAYPTASAPIGVDGGDGVTAVPVPPDRGPSGAPDRDPAPSAGDLPLAPPVAPLANPLRSRVPSATPADVPAAIASGAASMPPPAGIAGPSRGMADPPVMRGPAGGDRAADTTSARLRDEHITVAGDSWWSIAERAYGEGRYFRALYAWNRTVNPQVSLLPGTRLEIPTVSRLEAAWPKLVPPATAVGSPRGTD